MGARSCLYGIYYSFSFVFFLILTVFQWTVVLPNLPLCANTCGVSVLQPLLLVGTTGGNCAPGLTEQQYYQNNCFYCGSGSDGVTWPCPATSGVPGCGEGSVRLAETCIGQNNATSASGQPVTSDFVGGGSFIDGLGNRQLCFTTPINISLRAAEVPIVYIFLSCYFILAFFALLQVVLHCGCFKSIRGREWAQLNRFQRCAGGTIRTVPLILFTFNVLLMCLLITASVLFWGIGVCADAVDSLGLPVLKNALSASLIAGNIVFVLQCAMGSTMRLFVNPDPGLMRLPTLDAEDTKDSSSSGRNDDDGGIVARIKGFFEFLLKLAP